MTGWIKLHRSVTKHWIFKDAEKLKAWITILSEVNHAENKVNFGDSLFTVNRGESLKSLDTWAKLFGNGWNKSKVRRFFKLLESDSMIVTKSERKTTRLTVCNYDTYQDERNDCETQTKHKRNANETQVTPNKNDKNINNDKNNNITDSKNPTPPKKSKEELLLEREAKFKIEVYSYTDYPQEMLNAFFMYWSEPNRSKVKMLWETKPTFDVKRRLANWASRDNSFKPKAKQEPYRNTTEVYTDTID